MPQNAQALNTVTQYTGSSKNKLEASSKKKLSILVLRPEVGGGDGLVADLGLKH